MPKTKSTICKMSLALLAVILCASVIVALCLTTTTAQAYTTGGSPSTTATISGSLNYDGLKKLFEQLGSESGMYDGLPEATTAGSSVASKEIIVELGGMKWLAVYYSAATTAYKDDDAPTKGQASKDDKVLTLWLAEHSSSAYTWNQNFDDNVSTNPYPSNNYGISYMRAVVLNNGGEYYSPSSTPSQTTASDKKDATVSTTNNTNTEYAAITSGDITNYLVSPRYIEWQHDQQDQVGLVNCVSANLNNESWAYGGTYNDAWNYVKQNKYHYDYWKDDILWLPSLTETGATGYGSGLWQTNDSQRGSHIWLRSGYSNNSKYVYYLYGSDYSSSAVSADRLYVCPALHLNLHSAAAAVGLDIPHTEHTYEWVDAGNGNHYQQCTYKYCKNPTTEPAPHTVEYGTSINNSQHTGYCRVCHLEVTEAHKLDTDFTKDNNHDLNSHWQTCIVCGKVNESVHNWSSIAWTVSGGKHYKECVTCKQRYGESNHTLATFAQVDATCAADGVKAYYHCGGCDTYFSDSGGATSIGNATALAGWKTGNGKITKTNTHTPGAWEVSGNNHVKKCTVCSTTTTTHTGAIDYGTSVNATQHRGPCTTCGLEVTENHSIAGSYTASLTEHYKACSKCSYKDSQSTHAWDGMSWIVSGGKHYKECATCNQKYGESNHALATFAQVDATCSTTGLMAYYYCGGCSTYFSDQAGTTKIDNIETWRTGSGVLATNSNHKYDTVWHFDGSGGHYHVCEYNNSHHSAVTQHNYNNAYYDDGANHYQVCVDCRYETTHTQHSVTSWTNSGDTYHTGTCDACNNALTAAHTLSTLSKGEEGYYQQCAAPGCNYKVVYKDVDDTHEHKYTELQFDEVSHWDECECGARANVTPHSGEWVTNGSNHYKVCDTCSQQYSSGDHILTYQDNNSGKHYQKCEICTYTTDEQEHEVTIVTKVDDTNHEGYCDYCHAKVTTAHTPNGDYKTEGNNDLNGHWLTCTVCDSKYNETTHEWSGTWQQAEDYHYKKCNDCEQEKQEAHSATEWTDAQDGANHKGNCDECGKEIQEAHVLSELKKEAESGKYYQECTVAGCDYNVQYDDLSDVHVHNYEWNHDEFSHWEECSDPNCGARRSETAHDFDEWNISDGKHSHTCKESNCNYTLTEEHQYTDNWQIGETEHWKECSVCGNKDSDAHAYGDTWTEAGDQHYKECAICNYKNYEAHSYSGSWQVADDYHSRKCDKCEYVEEQTHNNGLAANHTAQVDPTEQDAGVKAYSQCTICGTYFDASGVKIGNSAELEDWKQAEGRIDPIVSDYCDHVITTVASNGSETHSGVCEICGETVSAPHEFGEDYVTDENGHWRECTICGEVKDYAEHNLEWTTDGEHTHTGVCAECGETLTRDHRWLFGTCLDCNDKLVEYSDGDVGIAAVGLVAQLFGLIAVAAIITRRIKR